MTDGNLLLWLIAVPAVAGLVSFLWPRGLSAFLHLLMLAVTGWMVVTSAGLVGRGSGLEYKGMWLAIGTLKLAADLHVTAMGGIMALLVSVFGFLLAMYNVAFLREQHGRHCAYMLWTLSAAAGAVLTNNLVFLLICWEVITVMLFLLIGLGGGKAKGAASKTFAILGLSDCALLLGIFLAVFGLGLNSLRMDELNVTANTPLSVLCFILFLAAALAKAGAVPLHTWIPAAAESAPTDVMAFLPASLDKLLGIYLLARTSLEFFVLGEGLKLLLMIIGAVTIVSAVMMAMVQHDLKRLLAFHAISQVGYMVLGIGTGTLIGVAGGIFHMVNHAIYKSCLFLTAGSVERQTGTTELDKLGGLARSMPLSFAACVVAALAISGVPPMNGFSSKWLIYQAALAVPSKWAPVLVIAAVFGSALTLASFIKVIHSVYLGNRSGGMELKQPVESPGWMTAPMLVLAGACVVFGVFATWPLRRIVAPVMDTIGMTGLTEHLRTGEITAINTLWDPVLATVLLLVGFLVGVGIFYLGSGFKVRRTRSYIGGEQMSSDASHYSGTGFYTMIRNLWGLRGIYRDAEQETFDIYKLGGWLGGVVVEGLRRCQTGVLSLYVSWVLIGLIIILVYMMGSVMR